MPQALEREGLFLSHKNLLYPPPRPPRQSQDIVARNETYEVLLDNRTPYLKIPDTSRQLG